MGSQIADSSAVALRTTAFQAVLGHGQDARGTANGQGWMEPNGALCFQLMEAESPELLQTWAAHWADLVEFEITPVQTSTEFWARAQ